MSGSLWKLRWWWRWFLADNSAEWHERRRRFHALTGLHPCYVQNRFVADDEVIAMQARKIKGLELQLNQQRKGYLRKIARLEDRLASLTTASASADQSAKQSSQVHDEQLPQTIQSGGGK